MFLASCLNVVTVITCDQALYGTICQKGMALSLRLCTPPSVVSRLHIANVGGIHASHLREMLSAFGEVKSLRMVASLNRGSDPVYGTSALATMIANTAIPPSVICDRDGLRLTVTISASTFASARPDGRKLAELSPPGEDAQEKAENPLSPAVPARVACRDWARVACKRGTACRFAHANSPPERPAPAGLPVHPQRRANVDAASAAAARDGADEPGVAEAGWLSVPKRQRKRQRRSPAAAQRQVSAARAHGSAQAEVDSTPKQRSAGPHELAGSGLTPLSKRHSAPLQDAELEDGEVPGGDEASPCPAPTASAPDPVESRSSSPTPAKSEDLAEASSRR